MTRIARVFPRKTNATPRDELAFFDEPGLFPPDVDAVHVSVTFTWDLPRAQYLAAAWAHVAPTSLGGPAVGTRGGEFVPGRYLKPGFVITSRGCPNRCGFCLAWRRDGNQVRELPIHDGWIVQDDNLLACSEPHIRAVCAMLARQQQRAKFSGGLEAARLADWHVDLLASLQPRPEVWFACDSADDWEPLAIAAGKMLAAGWTKASHRLRCYVLIGTGGDTPKDASCRLERVQRMGFTPMAMLRRDPLARTPPAEWRRFQRRWARPAIIHAN